MVHGQITLKLAPSTLSRVDALRIPERPGQPITNRSDLLRRMLEIGLKAFEGERHGGSAQAEAR
jgi:hypothetical protein